MPGNVFFGLRHGESEANAAGLIVSEPARGVAAWGLTPAGRLQVGASVRQAAARGELTATTFIYTSDFLRARDTAEVARATLGAGAVRLRTALRERAFGRHEGGPNTAYEPVWLRDRVDAAHTDGGVEAAEAVRERTWHLVLDLEAALTDQTVLLVAHGDPLQLLATAFAGLPAGEHRALPHWAPGEVRRLGTVR
jgi:broad specificity phosphatase PhoE